MVTDFSKMLSVYVHTSFEGMGMIVFSMTPFYIHPEICNIIPSGYFPRVLIPKQEFFKQ